MFLSYTVKFPFTTVKFFLSQQVKFPLTIVKFPCTIIKFVFITEKFPFTIVKFPFTTVKFVFILHCKFPHRRNSCVWSGSSFRKKEGDHFDFKQRPIIREGWNKVNDALMQYKVNLLNAMTTVTSCLCAFGPIVNGPRHAQIVAITMTNFQ